MKKQNGFISSSSSVTISYSTNVTSTKIGTSFDEWANTYLNNTYIDKTWDGNSWTTYETLDSNTVKNEVSWKTFYSSSYQRIEYFLEAVEKLKSPYTKNSKKYTPMTNYSQLVAADNLYDGFVDVVITFPVEIRLAGIELLNPWINKLESDNESENWRYLPKKFNIYKVDDSQINDASESLTYENDIARITNSVGEHTDYYPLRFDQIENSSKMILLGKYDVNWESLSSYKCFFKYNKNDVVSLNAEQDETKTGTATWKCKQLVLRIFNTDIRTSYTVNTGQSITKESYIYDAIAKYIQANEIKYGTTYYGNEPTVSDCAKLIGKKNISSNASKTEGFENWEFGSETIRSYENANDLKFETGIDYKLGGIQLLLSPDIFSVSEMKMYGYGNQVNNKVFIGEWDKDNEELEYYGTGIVKTSPFIDITDVNSASVSWKHNFNIPPKYLEANVFIRFNMDFNTFYAGDVISNLVNINKEPLTIKLTGTEVQVSIANGICFTNPDTGEFVTFKDGVGINLDKEGNYDAYKAAAAIGAPILDYGSHIASKVTGGYPFDIYFTVKRLF